MTDAVTEILCKFTELFSSVIHPWSPQLASNAVLEWKGVSVKGRSRIVKFLRSKQQYGLVLQFTTAQPVAAFEERDTHLSTMTTPPENLILQPSDSTLPPTSPDSKDTNKLESSSFNPAFHTPPRVQLISSDPPPLTEGERFLPLSSSDEEDESHHCRNVPALSDLHRNMYSELQYLESIGVMRSSREPKHRGTRTTHHIPREDSPPVPDGLSTPVPSGSGSIEGDNSDKQTKLKLSYRRHVLTQEPQFALIIYEDLKPRSSKVRRNLFSDDDPQVDTKPPDEPEPSSPSRLHTVTDSPDAHPLVETPPPVPSPPPAEVTPPHTPLEPPGTPHRQRRILPAGMRTSPRRSRAVMNFTIATDEESTGSSSSNNNNNSLQTWPRKTNTTGSPGGPAAKNRKLATGSSTVRKPLRF